MNNYVVTYHTPNKQLTAYVQAVGLIQACAQTLNIFNLTVAGVVSPALVNDGYNISFNHTGV